MPHFVLFISVFRSLQTARRRHKHYGSPLAAALLCALGLLSPRVAVGQTTPIIQDDFENGTLQGWAPRGGSVVLANTTEAAHGGTHSLKTTGRTAGFNGPALDVTTLLVKGATYQVTCWVHLVSGEAATQLKVTVQRTVSGANSFDSVAQSSATGVTDAAWVQLTGLYAFGGGDPSALLLYIESASATASYYVDDFGIVKIADPPGPPPNTTGLSTNFEDGKTDGWTSRTGTEQVNVSTADAHTGGFSLLTTGRTASFQGPNFDVSKIMFNGSQYRVSLWAKLAPGEAPAQLRVSLQRNAGTLTTFHTVVGNTNVTADAWMRLTAVYDVALANSSLFLYVESASSTAPFPSFHIDDVQITYVPPPVIEANLPSIFRSLADFFPVGAGGVGALEISGVHGDLLKKHFNSLTPGNDMKWDATEPSEGNFRFTNADAEVSFAEANHIIVRGHNLVWHQQIPAWVFTDPVTGTTMQPSDTNKALLLQRLQNHIRAVAGHFAGKLYAWDVANEVIDQTQPDCLRRSTWYNIIGPSYIDVAFQTAHETDPNVKLYINDFNSTEEPKRTCLFNLVMDLRSRGIPVDGVGHQMHNNLEFPALQHLIDTINMFATLGVDQQITEMDISIYTGSNNTPIPSYDEIPADRFVTQGYDYRNFFQAYRQLKGKISSVTLWGLADDNSWLTSSGKVDAPLAFDDQLQHKLAYLGIVDPQQLPGANIGTTISADSSSVLSGRSVTYTITVLNSGPNDAAGLSLVDTLPAGTVFASFTAPTGWTCTTPAVGSAGQVNCIAAALGNGASAQFILVVTINCATPDGTHVTDSVTATSTTRNPNPSPNNIASVDVSVSNPPPVISGFAASRSFLWPPFHRLVRETLTYTVSATCDVGLVPVITVSSNQPEEGRHHHRDVDWVVIDATHVLLRAENEPSDRDHGESEGASRVYTITATVTDSAGSRTSSSVNVSVSRPSDRHDDDR
jgi:endo-1,4-beta-xylanase